MHDAVDWKIIDENPLLKVKTPKNSVKVNEFVPREVVDKLMKKANPVWQVILGLSRYGGLRTPSETLSLRWEDIDWEMSRMSIPEPKVEHHEGRGIRSCPIFPELRPILDEAFEIFGDKSEFVVAAPQYRAPGSTTFVACKITTFRVSSHDRATNGRILPGSAQAVFACGAGAGLACCQTQSCVSPTASRRGG